MASADRGEIAVRGERGRDVGAVSHAVQILRVLSSAQGAHGVTVIARESGVSPSTCFNILRTLVRARFVAFDGRDKTYRLGLGVAELALGLVGIAQADLIRPELERLALNYEMLLALWQVTDDRHLVLLDRAYGDAAVRVEMRPRLRLPMLAGAVGRAAAAILDLPDAELRRRFATLRWESPPAFRAYAEEVAEGRKRGWSEDRGQLYRGIVSVAAVAADRERRPRFGFSAIGIVGRHDGETLTRVGLELRDVAQLVEQALFSGRNDVQGATG